VPTDRTQSGGAKQEYFMMNRTRHEAFTLIELITVVAILGMLMAILLPSLSSSRRRAKANVCLSTLKGMGTSTQMYLNENRDQFFPYRLPTLKPGSTEPYANGYNRLAPRWQWYVDTSMGPVIDPKPFERLREPWDDWGLHMGGDEGRRMTIDLFTCPSLDDPVVSHDIRDGAYGYNYQYLGNTRNDADETRWDNFAVGLHLIKCPAKTVLFADSRGADVRHGKHSFTLDPPRLGVEVNAFRFGPDLHDVRSSADKELLAYSPAEARHDNQANVAFVDSHAESMTLLEMGYEVNYAKVPDVDAIPYPEVSTLPKGTAIPKMLSLPPAEPTSERMRANNAIWTGLCADPIRDKVNNPQG